MDDNEVEIIEKKFCNWKSIKSFIEGEKGDKIVWKTAKTIDSEWKDICVYVLAISDEPLNRTEFKFTDKIVYIGKTDVNKGFWSGRFKTIRETLDGTAANKNNEAGKKIRPEHDGILRIMESYEFSQIITSIYISIAKFSRVNDPNKRTPEEWQRIGDVRKLECDCFAAFRNNCGIMPVYSKQ